MKPSRRAAPASAGVSSTAAKWPWLDQMLAAWRLLVLALFLGMSLAAVMEMKIECRDEPDCVRLESGGRLLLEDGVSCLLRVEQKRRQCELIVGTIRIPLPWRGL